jgi:predicted nucleic acid-binding protein
VDYVVLDTDVSSQVIRDRLTGPLLARLANQTWCVTFVTVGELWKWADMRSWGARSRRDLENWLASVVVLPYDKRVSRMWGSVAAAGYRRGRPTPVNDTWIAACCLAHGVPLATQNVKDFTDFVEHEGLVLVTA